MIIINGHEYRADDLVLALDGSMSFKTDADLTTLAAEFPAVVEVENGIYNNVELVCIRPSSNMFEVVARCHVASVADTEAIHDRITDVELAVVELAEEVYK